MAQQAAAIQWATLKFDPTEAKPSQKNPDWAPQHSVLVTFGEGQEERLYFAQGQYSALRKGDTVMIEFNNGRWRMCKTQTPELVALLGSRNPQPAQNNVVPMQQRTQPRQAAEQPKQGPSREEMEKYIGASARLFRRCWEEAENTMPATCLSEDIRAIATTLFIQTSRKFGL